MRTATNVVMLSAVIDRLHGESLTIDDCVGLLCVQMEIGAITGASKGGRRGVSVRSLLCCKFFFCSFGPMYFIETGNVRIEVQAPLLFFADLARLFFLRGLRR